jgi:hypothetical protein
MCALRAHLVARGLSRAGQILTPSLARTHAHGCHKDVHVDRINCGPCANINREIACEQNEPISDCPLLIEITMRIPGQTDAFELLSSCSHRYTHGNLTKSEAFEGSEHEDKQARVEKLSSAAIAIALLARKVASLIQVCRVLCEMLCRGSAESTSSGRISVQSLLFSERKGQVRSTNFISH